MLQKMWRQRLFLSDDILSGKMQHHETTCHMSIHAPPPLIYACVYVFYSFFSSYFEFYASKEISTYNFTLIKVAAVKEDGVITQISFGQKSLHFFMERFGLQMNTWEDKQAVTATDMIT